MRWLLLAASACASVACPGSPAQTESKRTQQHAEEHGHAHEALPRRIRPAAEVVAAAQISTVAVTREALVVTIALPGELSPDPDRSARIASPIAGLIERVSFKEGSVVAKGEPLAVVRVPDLGKLRATLAATLGRAKAARINAERMTGLVQKRLASEQMSLDALAEADALDEQARAASDQLAALGMAADAHPSQLVLRAPTAGTVVVRNAVVGQPVTADEVIAEIVDLTELWFLGRVFEKDLGRLTLSAEAEVELNAYPKERFRGLVEYIGQKVDPIARTVTARIRVRNRADLLRVGLFGSAYVSTNEERGQKTDAERAARGATLVVPREAITEIAGKPVVFVKHADGDYELHELTLGDAAAGKVQVIAGLQEGEQVVARGVFTLKSAVLKSTFAEDEH